MESSQGGPDWALESVKKALPPREQLSKNPHRVDSSARVSGISESSSSAVPLTGDERSAIAQNRTARKEMQRAELQAIRDRYALPLKSSTDAVDASPAQSLTSNAEVGYKYTMADIPAPSEASKLTLTDVTQQVTQVGKEKNAETRARIAEKAQRIKDAFNRTKDVGKNARDKTVMLFQFARGLSDEKGRQVITEYTNQQIDAGKQSVENKVREVQEEAIKRKDLAVDAFHEGLRKLADETNQRLIEPTVAGAKEVQHKVVEGAKTGGLFALDTAVYTVDSTYRGVKFATVDVPTAAAQLAGREVTAGVNAVKDADREAMYRANNWAYRFGFRMAAQAEGVKHDITSRRAEVGAKWHKQLAQMNRPLESFSGWRKARAEKTAQKRAESYRVQTERGERQRMFAVEDLSKAEGSRNLAAKCRSMEAPTLSRAA